MFATEQSAFFRDISKAIPLQCVSFPRPGDLMRLFPLAITPNVPCL